MASIALIVDRRVEDTLLPDLVEHGHAVAVRVDTARELIERIPGLSLDVVIAGAAQATLSRELLGACDSAGIRLIALAGSDRDRRAALDLGLHDVLDAGAAWADIEAALVVQVAASYALSGPTPEPDGAPGIVAVWGPAGAPGRSTVALTIASELAAEGRRILLVDADSYGGTIAHSLGMLDEAPGFAAACRLAAADALTGEEFERVTRIHDARRGPFGVLTGIASSARWPELSAGRVSEVLSGARGHFDTIIVDTGFSLETDEEISSDLFAPRRNGATVAALRAADRVIAVGAADPVGLSRLLHGYVELVETVEDTPVTVAVNRVRASALGIDAGSQIRSALRRFGGIERVHLIPDDQRGFDAALLAGRPIGEEAPKSSARIALARLALEELLPPRPTGRQRPRRMRHSRQPVPESGKGWIA